MPTSSSLARQLTVALCTTAALLLLGDLLVVWKLGAVASGELSPGAAAGWLAASAALACAVAAALGLRVVRSVTQGARQAAAAVQAAANGQFDAAAPAGHGRHDELGAVLDAVAALRGTLGRLREGQLHMARQHDAGWIDETIPADQLPGLYGQIAGDINALVASHIAVKMKVVEVVRPMPAATTRPAWTACRARRRRSPMPWIRCRPGCAAPPRPQWSMPASRPRWTCAPPT